jgi:hypothetical protein
MKQPPSPVNVLLDQTAKHDQELERQKLEMLIEDNKHRKSLLLLRVAGLSKLAPHIPYFKEVIKPS